LKPFVEVVNSLIKAGFQLYSIGTGKVTLVKNAVYLEVEEGEVEIGVPSYHKYRAYCYVRRKNKLLKIILTEEKLKDVGEVLRDVEMLEEVAKLAKG